MVYVLALAAALANALTSVFQRMGVEDAPEESTMTLSLMTHAIRGACGSSGFFIMICSFLFQSFALHVGRLSVVQPILTMELLFLVFILGTYFGYQITAPRVDRSLGHRLRARRASWSSPIPGGGDQVPNTLEWIVVGGIAVVAIVVAVVATRWGPRWWKAAMFGTAAPSPSPSPRR